MKIKIFIADDDDNLRYSLEEYFKNEPNFDLVGVADNGASAIDFVTNTYVDVLVVDAIMPGIDGFSVLKYVNKLEKRPKVIMVSELNSKSFISQAGELGADYFLLKPFDMKILKERVQDFFCEELNTLEKVVPDKTKTSIDEKVSNIFITVGIPAHIKGYQFLREAIKMAVAEPSIISSITKGIYPGVAKMFDTSSSKVERAIRHAIEVAWNKGKIENINNLFGLKVYTSNEKPTNGEFIALVADKLLIEGV